MIRRILLTAFLACVLLPAMGAAPPVLRFPVWACSDGKGTISLFWLPPGGEWPAGGYRLERVSRGRATVLTGAIRPGQDARAMMEIGPGDADAVRSLADGIERGTLSDDERNRSISVLGRAAAADAMLGRALGVRYTDVLRGRGKFVYRLTPLGADGRAGSAMESAEVDPGRPTPAPGRPAGLRAQERDDGVALFWTDPPAGPVAPIVGYRVDRGDGGRRAAALTPKPVLLDRHLRRGEPEFVDGAAPANKLTYQVRGVDVFGRMSAPARAVLTVRKAARAKAPSAAQAPDLRPAPPPATAGPDIAPAPGVAAAPPRSAREPSAPSIGKQRATTPAPARVEASPAAAGPAATPAPAATATAAESAAQYGRADASSRGPASPDVIAVASTAPGDSRHSTTAPAAAAAPTPEPSRPPATAPQTPEPAVWSAPKEEPPTRTAGFPPPPVIVGIAGMGDRVVVRFRPGQPEELTERFLVIRSESPTGTGVTIGRPIPGADREWQDTTVSAGQYFWYRLVAVDSAGNRSEPSNPKWVSTGSR